MRQAIMGSSASLQARRASLEPPGSRSQRVEDVFGQVHPKTHRRSSVFARGSGRAVRRRPPADARVDSCRKPRVVIDDRVLEPAVWGIAEIGAADVRVREDCAA